MNIINKIAGKTLYGIARLISIVLDTIIALVETMVMIISSIARGFVVLIGMGGCLFLLLFAGPLGVALLLNPTVLLTIAFFIIAPILGTKFISYLKYIRYVTTEYLFDRASYLIDGKSYQFETFDEYKKKYKRMQDEKRRKRQEENRARQERKWEERFRQWNTHQNSQRSNWGYGSEQAYVNPTNEFKTKYEKSCNLLEVGYSEDQYQIKLAYRKKAKRYHPDINKSPDATEKFQQVNEAYEFLSDGNIERYKSIV
ncbi:MAG: DnaJ domain-containing protein [Senegalia sp. (in: firmicutes)]